MPFNPNLPADNSPLNSGEMRTQLNALKALIDALTTQVNNLLPVGFIGAWPKSRANIPALIGTWVECNGQVLNDPESPFDGQTMDDLNITQRFLRGAATSGGTGGSDTHSHTTAQDVGNNGNNNSGAVSEATGTTSVESSLPSYYEVVWVMRVK